MSPRVLIIDADVPKRLATEIRYRGRRAFTVASLGLVHSKDSPLLQDLAERSPVDEWVLVTGDDVMPWEHADVIAETGSTIATIDPRRPEDVTQHHWRRDVAHRWAHKMQVQEPGSIRRYSLATHLEWRPRKRHLALDG